MDQQKKEKNNLTVNEVRLQRRRRRPRGKKAHEIAITTEASVRENFLRSRNINIIGVVVRDKNIDKKYVSQHIDDDEEEQEEEEDEEVFNTGKTLANAGLEIAKTSAVTYAATTAVAAAGLSITAVPILVTSILFAPVFLSAWRSGQLSNTVEAVDENGQKFSKTVVNTEKLGELSKSLALGFISAGVGTQFKTLAATSELLTQNVVLSGVVRTGATKIATRSASKVLGIVSGNITPLMAGTLKIAPEEDSLEDNMMNIMLSDMKREKAQELEKLSAEKRLEFLKKNKYKYAAHMVLTTTAGALIYNYTQGQDKEGLSNLFQEEENNALKFIMSQCLEFAHRDVTLFLESRGIAETPETEEMKTVKKNMIEKIAGHKLLAATIDRIKVVVEDVDLVSEISDLLKDTAVDILTNSYTIQEAKADLSAVAAVTAESAKNIVKEAEDVKKVIQDLGDEEEVETVGTGRPGRRKSQSGGQQQS